MIAITGTTVNTPLAQAVWADYLAANQTQWPGSRAPPTQQAWFFLDAMLTLYLGLDAV